MECTELTQVEISEPDSCQVFGHYNAAIRDILTLCFSTANQSPAKWIQRDDAWLSVANSFGSPCPALMKAVLVGCDFDLRDTAEGRQTHIEFPGVFGTADAFPGE